MRPPSMLYFNELTTEEQIKRLQKYVNELYELVNILARMSPSGTNLVIPCPPYELE